VRNKKKKEESLSREGDRPQVASRGKTVVWMVENGLPKSQKLSLALLETGGEGKIAFRRKRKKAARPREK